MCFCLFCPSPFVFGNRHKLHKLPALHNTALPLQGIGVRAANALCHQGRTSATCAVMLDSQCRVPFHETRWSQRSLQAALGIPIFRPWLPLAPPACMCPSPRGSL